MAKRKAATPRRTKKKTTDRPAWLDEGAALIAQRNRELADEARKLCAEMGDQVAAHEKDADRLRQLEREWVDYCESRYGNGVMLTGDLASEYRDYEAAYRAAKANLSESLGIGDNPPPVNHVARRSAGAFLFPPTDLEAMGLQAQDVVWAVGAARPAAATDDCQPRDALAAPASALRDPQSKGKRPAYDRDHEWLRLKREHNLTPAKIRKLWNEKHPFDPVETATVKKGIQKAEREQSC